MSAFVYRKNKGGLFPENYDHSKDKTIFVTKKIYDEYIKQSNEQVN